VPDYDAIVVGSGINGLAAAALLADAGRRVAVLERASMLGGAVQTVELAPGYRHDLFATSHAGWVGSRAYRRLKPRLDALGLEYLVGDTPTASLYPDSQAVFLTTDRDENVRALESLAPGDGLAWGRLTAELDGLRDVVGGILSTEFPSWDALRLAVSVYRRLGRHRLRMLAGSMLESSRDLLEAAFATDAARGLLAPWSLHAGLGPDDASSGFATRLLTHGLEASGTPMPIGGGARLIEALAAVVSAAGGTHWTNADVARIILERDRTAGVQLASGDIIAAPVVIANVTPTQLYERLLADVEVREHERAGARRFRYGRARVQIHLALSEPPCWDGGDRLLRAATLHVTGGINAISRAVNEAARGLLPAEPTLTCAQPVAVDPSRAPDGAWILSIQLHEVPPRPRGDAAGEIDVGDGTWTETIRERFADRVVALLARHAPNLESAIIHRRVFSPIDFEAHNINFLHGDGSSGAMTLDQGLLWRPRAEIPGHKTPVRGLYIVGAATHPGPGLGAGSGIIVAERLLRRRRLRSW
jgi:phytoene dehydrogenase-like protein